MCLPTLTFFRFECQQHSRSLGCVLKLFYSQIFPLAIEHQFQEPEPIQQNLFANEETSSSSTVTVTVATATKTVNAVVGGVGGAAAAALDVPAANADGVDVEHENEKSLELIDLSRPSDFRLQALADKANKSSCEFGTRKMKKNGSSDKKPLRKCFDNFMGNLIEAIEW